MSKDQDVSSNWDDDILKLMESRRIHERISRSLNAFKAPEYALEEELKRLRARKIEPETGIEPENKQRYLGYSRAWRVAAAIALLVGTGIILFWQDIFHGQTVQITADAQQELFLPDSSFVVLNDESDLSYQAADWSQSRELQLEGEAYFQVKHGSKFKVHTDAGSVTVLGTRFNVKNRPGFFQVSCYEGSVLVTIGTSNSLLTAGEEFRIIGDSRGFKTNVEPNSQPSWSSGITTFRSVPLYEVIREFERQHNVKVKYKDRSSGRLFTGGFNQNNLESGLKAIAIPLGLKYEIIDDRTVELK